MILTPIPRLHSHFQHPKDHGRISMLETQFPNFALFTTLLGRVRLSQSVGCKTTTTLHFWRFIANPTHCLSDGQNCSGVGLLPALAFIPSLNRVRLERGTSCRGVKFCPTLKLICNTATDKSKFKHSALPHPSVELTLILNKVS
jgi:hypothetical protein